MRYNVMDMIVVDDFSSNDEVFNRIRVNGGVKKASVHFCEKEIIFELPGEKEF